MQRYMDGESGIKFCETSLIFEFFEFLWPQFNMLYRTVLIFILLLLPTRSP